MSASGRCPECLKKWHVRKDGTLQPHRIYPQVFLNPGWLMCAGSEGFPIDDEHEHCHPEYHRCADGGGPGEAHRYDDNRAGR